MSDSLANGQLELACRLGAIDEVVEALKDGADIDFGSGTPLFVAISAGEREVVALLVEKGADVTLFGLEAGGEGEGGRVGEEVAPGGEESESEGEAERGGEEGAAGREKLIDALMALVKQVAPERADDDMVNAKVVRAFDRMIRKAGLGEPIVKKRAGEYGIFAEGLKWMAAEECEAAVTEFLEMVEMVRAEVGAEGVPAFLVENAARIAELSERYVTAEEAPGDLLKEYMKERKRLAEGEGGELKS